MTRAEIITLAHQLDCLDSQHYGSMWVDKLVTLCEAVAVMAAVKERERLAQLAESRTDGWLSLTAQEIRAGIVEREQS